MKHISYAAQTFPDSLYSLDGISKQTIEEHIKLYQGYVNKYNEIGEKLAQLTDEELTKGNQVYSFVRELKVEQSFAWGGIINHEIYFNHLGNKGTTSNALPDKLSSVISKSFGSYENYIKDLKASGMAARGWVWTVLNKREKRLTNIIGDSQNTYLFWYTHPILALDVYEHAYYLDFKTARASYIDAFIKNINWETVAKNFEM